MPEKVIIIGAGPAGLTAAYELIRRSDIKPVVLEATSEIGGLSRTILYKGNRIDIGGHRFFSKSKQIMSRWQDILPVQSLSNLAIHRPSLPFRLPETGPDPETEDSVMLVRNRISHILFLGKLFDYPLSVGLSTLRKLGPIRTLQIGLSYVETRLGPNFPPQSLEDLFIHRFGKELYRIFFKDYTEKVWGVSCRQIQPEWGQQRIKNLSIAKTVMHALTRSFTAGAIPGKQTETSLINTFLYPKFGPGQLWEETAGRIERGGGKIFLNHRVVGLKHKGNTVNRIHVRNEQTGKSERLPCDVVFSSMPVRDIIAGFEGPIPDRVRETARGLVYRDFIMVGLLLERMHPDLVSRSPSVHILPDQWIYIQEKGVRVGRVQIFNNWSPFMAADPNLAWIGAEYFCNRGDAIWNLSEKEMISLSISELEKIGLVRREDFIEGLSIRVPDAYPAYFGSYPEFNRIRLFTDTFSNLFLIGRNGMHRYNNQDHSMLSAITAVDNWLKGITSKANIWSVNTEKALNEELQK